MTRRPRKRRQPKLVMRTVTITESTYEDLLDTGKPEQEGWTTPFPVKRGVHFSRRWTLPEDKALSIISLIEDLADVEFRRDTPDSNAKFRRLHRDFTRNRQESDYLPDPDVAVPDDDEMVCPVCRGYAVDMQDVSCDFCGGTGLVEKKEGAYR